MNCAEARPQPFRPTSTASSTVSIANRWNDIWSACSGCSGRVHVQTRFRAAVRAHLHRPEVPFTLRRRIEEALKAQPIAPLRWPAWMSLPRIVPAAAAVFLIVAITGTVRRQNSKVLEQAERMAHTQMPMDVTGSDCGSIASWFRGKSRVPRACARAGWRRHLPGRPARQRRRAARRVPRVSAFLTVIASRSWCSIRATSRSNRASVAWSTAARSISARARHLDRGVPRPWPRLRHDIRHG